MGINGIKSTLKSVPNDIKINLVSTPEYRAVYICQNRQEGLEKIDQLIKDIEITIKSKKGTFKLTKEPEAKASFSSETPRSYSQISQ